MAGPTFIATLNYISHAEKDKRRRLSFDQLARPIPPVRRTCSSLHDFCPVLVSFPGQNGPFLSRQPPSRARPFFLCLLMNGERRKQGRDQGGPAGSQSSFRRPGDSELEL